MKSNFLRHWKKRRLRIQVWQHRLQENWQSLASDLELQPLLDCSLRVSRGPFFNGAMLVDRRLKRAQIIVQIPDDGYVTESEERILSRYSIAKRDLPFFILYHEASHLLDILPFVKRSDRRGLERYLNRHRQLAAAASSYKDLEFERRADDFAFRMLMKSRQAG
jgi:hypothetical protein